ncbi:MAG: hypothetical protein ACREQL_07690 [Candidatus Binatia bacterium]
MKTLRNKTHRPLSVPLPRGKTLHLGPGKTGQISSNDVDHPGLKKLVDAGEIEIVGDGPGPSEEGGGGKKAPTGIPVHTGASAGRRSGDR